MRRCWIAAWALWPAFAFGQASINGNAGLSPLYWNGAPIGNTASGNDDPLMTYTMAASQMLHDGDRIRVMVGGGAAANAPTKVITFRVNGVQLAQISVNSTKGIAWRFEVNFLRNSPAQVAYDVQFLNYADAISAPTNGQLALDLTKPVTFQVSGQNQASTPPSVPGTIVANFATVDYLPRL